MKTVFYVKVTAGVWGDPLEGTREFGVDRESAHAYAETLASNYQAQGWMVGRGRKGIFNARKGEETRWITVYEKDVNVILAISKFCHRPSRGEYLASLADLHTGDSFDSVIYQICSGFGKIEDAEKGFDLYWLDQSGKNDPFAPTYTGVEVIYNEPK